MAVVLVHNNPHGSEADARRANRTRAQVQDEFYWNLWRRAIPPFNALTDGVDILLLESWSGGAVISWHVRAVDVITTRVADKAGAIRVIERQSGLTRAQVLSDEYTRDKPDDVTALIFWAARPVKRLDLPKPPQLKVNRNGWLVTDDATLASVGVQLAGKGRAPVTPPAPAPRKGRGQGRRLDVEAKQAVEQRAEAVAEAWCRGRGWTDIRHVAARRAWDFEADDTTGQRRYIEVKGTTGQLGEVEVTANEVAKARMHGAAHLIVIVHGIDLGFDGNGWKAKGGTTVVYDPWSPRDAELKAVHYRWKPGAKRRPT